MVKAQKHTLWKGLRNSQSDSILNSKPYNGYWCADDRNGACVTGYIVEHRRTTSPHWVKATPGKVQHNRLTLSGLEPGWRYQFRIKAVNSYGHSEPSDVSDPVTMTVHRTAVVAPVFVRGIEDRVALENDQVCTPARCDQMRADATVFVKRRCLCLRANDNLKRRERVVSVH